jgi:hypothetical protein
MAEIEQARDEFQYSRIPTVTRYVVPQKQAVKRHYGSHQYFTKRAWNVIQTYIENFTKPGDLVCDPFGGSGVTIIEALVLGRKGIYVDVSAWAGFLAAQVAIAPVDLSKLAEGYELVEKACAAKINDWWSLTDKKAAQIKLKRWYPEKQILPRNADVKFVHELFTHKQLLALSELLYQIGKIDNEKVRNLLRYTFSATLYMCNRTFISAKDRKESRGGSSIFSIYRYKVAKRSVNLNPWEVFSGRFEKLMACKRETNQLIGDRPGGSTNARFIKGYCQKLTEYVESESVDYIFTDPPYGAHIAYLDLTRMWDAWLGFQTTEQDREEETIEDGDAKHTPTHFKEKLASGIAEMFRVLKYDRWMSIVFQHREPAMWDAVVKAAEAAGFEYVNTVPQPLNVIWSMHKKKNYLTVVSGELILNFRKVKNPRTLAIASVGSDAVSLIKDSAELTIVQNNGATTDAIYTELIPKLLENGLLGEVSAKIGDITPILSQEFDYDAAAKIWNAKAGRKLGCHIPLDSRIRFYVKDFLNQMERQGKKATIDDITFNVLPKLKNGEQPTKQTLLNEVRKIAAPVDGRYWAPWDNPQQLFEFASDDSPGMVSVRQRKPEEDYEHDEMLYMLTKLGLSAGFACHIGKKEQGYSFEGHPLADLSIKQLSFTRSASSYSKAKIRQIDLLWLDSGRPTIAFEIEHSTPVTTALDRFIELLRVDQNVAERLIIVAPTSRRRKIDEVLSQSHYIGAPMYMETKVRYLWYTDVLDILDSFANQQPTKPALLSAIMKALRSPTTHPRQS